tara:strand:- start:1259 stop:1489 length:231 start_codon:yes stop_codon:yes gene_type:complete
MINMTWKDDIKKDDFGVGPITTLNNLFEAIRIALITNKMVMNSKTSEISEQDKGLLTSSSRSLDKAQKQIERMMRR